MNTYKVEKEIFDALAKGDRACFFPVDDEHILVTTKGYVGYILTTQNISFNASKLTRMQPLKYLEVVKPENELFLTDDYRASGADRRMFRRLTATGKNTFVDTRYLINFQGAKFFQERANAHGLITVTEKNALTQTDTPVAVVLPVRAIWEDDDYYKGML